MNYYPHHIGDYRSHTQHLSNEEDLAYRRLLEMYYDSEAPIPKETQWVARRLRVGTEVIATVLHDFFTLADDGWHHPRCDREIAEYHAIKDRNRKNGKKGGRPKSLKTNGNNPVGFESDSSRLPVATDWKGNQEPRTKNQEPEKDARSGRPSRSSRAVTLSAFLAECRATGVRPIPDDHPIRSYCRDAGISADMAALAWSRFREEHTTGTRKAKRYVDWPATFANSVKDRWYKFWFVHEDGDATWTSEGLQEKRAADARIAREDTQHTEHEHEPA